MSSQNVIRAGISEHTPRKRIRDDLLSWRWWLGLRDKTITEGLLPQLSVAVVIPAFNEEASIAATIKSVQAQTYPVAEIIVVDDCSTDRTGEVARALGVSVLRMHKNKGSKALAQNEGIMTAVSSELFVTVDADTILAPDAIEKTLRFFNDPLTCAVCGFVIPQRINTLWERGRFIEYLYGFSVVKSAQDHMRAVLVASGCFTVFRTDIVKQFGGFEERTMAEDMDLTWKLMAAGYHVYYTPEAISYTVDPPTFNIFWKQNDRWYRGFLQNVKVRKFNLFQINKRFGFLVYFYLLWNLFGSFGIPGLVYWLADSAQSALLWMLALQGFLVWPPVLVTAWQHGRFWKAVTSLPAFLIVPYVNATIFLCAVWKEWILRRSLTEWHKGH